MVITETGVVGEKYKENEELKRYIRQLQEENNFLRLRAEILLDMVRNFSVWQSSPMIKTSNSIF